VARLRAELRRIAPTDIAVLVLGETGAGKEVAAQAVHRLSGRTGGFVPVNLAAIPKELVEAELFGSVRGAYTGAERARQGLVTSAHRGTLFLDEIGDLDVAMQVKLLRVLESGEVRPVGSTAFHTVDARVVSATHRDLLTRIDDGTFRADLYYRLAPAVVRVPPLRERLDDLPLLRRIFEREASQRIGLPPCRWSEAAQSALLRYHWPGNIRQLRHVVELVMVEARGGVVSRGMLPFGEAEAVAPQRWGQATADFRRRLLRHTLLRHGGNRSAAARELGISRQTLLYHLRSLGAGGWNP
jgi:two-component system NtrC family response regulator